jgi:predicted transcriptional regulator
MFFGRTEYEYTANDMEAAKPRMQQTIKETAVHLNKKTGFL